VLTGPAAPYNQTFTTNGIASTLATICAAALGFQSLDKLSPAQVESISQAHLLLAMFNAWQPGVFALSGWDLCGTLTLEASRVHSLVAAGDTRWIHRAAYDLMDFQPDAVESASGMPRGASLYGPLPHQLTDHNSFASRLRRVLDVRSRSGVATAHQLAVPETSDPALLVMIHRLPSEHIQATALNFSSRHISGRARSEYLAGGDEVTDLWNDRLIGQIEADRSIRVDLAPHAGASLLITRRSNPPG
jgi:trehalose synthase